MNSKTVQELALPVGVTLDRFIMLSQSAFPYATGELSQLLRDIALAGKIINREINRAGLVDIAGGSGTENIQGENQQKLDIVANHCNTHTPGIGFRARNAVIWNLSALENTQDKVEIVRLAIVDNDFYSLEYRFLLVVQTQQERYKFILVIKS